MEILAALFGFFMGIVGIILLGISLLIGSVNSKQARPSGGAEFLGFTSGLVGVMCLMGTYALLS